MGSLSQMIQFLNGTCKTLDEIIGKLDKLQEYFNNNYSNVRTVRNNEIEFLQDEFFSNTKSYPDEFLRDYEKNLKSQEDLYEKNLAKLCNKQKEMRASLEKYNRERLDLFNEIRKSNRKLDIKEEDLKKRIAEYEKEIGEYNRTIDEMNSGFGFVTNFIRMRKIQKNKDKLIDMRDLLVGEIEEIRARWQDELGEKDELEKVLLEEWNNCNVELSIINEKVENLTKNRDELIRKGAFMATLENLKGNESFLSGSVKTAPPDKCSRCSSENKGNRFFCNYCGERFSDDRPDLMGSLMETGELNSVHENLITGIEKSVSFLALMKGLNKGVAEFTKSVSSVKESQDTYSALPNLSINVPEFSRDMADRVEKLNDKINVEFFNLHPKEFSESVSAYEKKVFTDENIEKYFNKMGNELDKTTKEQWG